MSAEREVIRLEGTLCELRMNLDAYVESWREWVAEDPDSDFAAGIVNCLEDVERALTISRRPEWEAAS